MNIGSKSIKILLFVFNLVFSLCGLAVLICGVFGYLNLKNPSTEIQATYSTIAIGIIILGGITFIIAFFGCVGSIWENRCMIITFGIFISIILVIQIALSIYLFVVLNKVKDSGIENKYKEIFDKYSENRHSQAIVDGIQFGMKCCGVDGPNDYNTTSNATETYPWSCCNFKNDLKFQSCELSEVYDQGCRTYLVDILMSAGKLLGGVILGIAVVELIGILLAVFLAHVIRNDKRRAAEA
ncbi:hypothetical protein PV327_010222 [Microctonus hyperodae]|uniref:Tetraspanin n=1 Tax=Microctonus hyperodae TaxID=165561 RepID=A0AA39FS24_MICHY|nr:hypothetical protein PV327_010222 [Microctonus hyperodae]